MPHCCAYGCNNESKKQTDTAGKGENKVTFHQVPETVQGELRKKTLIAIGWPKENLPKCPYLCSHHYDPRCFDESVDLRNKLLGGAKWKLKDDTVPMTFAHKPAPKVRASSVVRATKWKHQAVRRTVTLLRLN